MLPGLAVGRLPAGYAPPPLPAVDALTAPVAPGAKRVLVVGAGICGAAVAAMLVERGHSVTVVDEAPLVGGTALRSTAILFIGPAGTSCSAARLHPSMPPPTLSLPPLQWRSSAARAASR